MKSNCVLIEQGQRTLRAAVELQRQIRRLTRVDGSCRPCPRRSDCPARDQVEAMLDEAFHTILQEWELI